ncbi:MAG: MerR family transcriptional regulator [candidate division Zixibacteria bacterium]|nr:MerR family transcriptional regulator [candidate division Zixibacteria bacterium]
MEYSLTVDDIVQQTGFTTSTVRRYLRDFTDFIPSNPINRKQVLYGEETVAIVTRISDLYGSGKYTPDIREILKYEVPMTVEVHEVVELPKSDEIAVAIRPDVQDQIDRVVALAESLVEKMQQIDDHETEITAMRQTLVDTRAQVTGCIDQMTAVERAMRDESRVDALTREIQQQNATIASLTDEIAAFRQQPVTFWGWVRQTFKF